jgi:hypothetical protein
MAGDINIFKKYVDSDIFIETGSYYGKGIDWALEAGFETIISIEITDYYYKLCKEKYRDNKNVTIILGDSSKVLHTIIKKINKNIVFWLDGHYTEQTTNFSDDAGWFPIIKELEAIKKHKINNHTILIDDWRCFDSSYCYYNKHKISQDVIKNKIMEINPNYKISFEDGYIESDILIAKI